jgi:ubiquinone/menaquinone biosynthesis C-methylase UbiE
LYDAVPKEKWDELKILGGDVSNSMLAYLKGRGEKEGWKGLETRIVDGNVRLHVPLPQHTQHFPHYPGHTYLHNADSLTLP